MYLRISKVSNPVLVIKSLLELLWGKRRTKGCEGGLVVTHKTTIISEPSKGLVRTNTMASDGKTALKCLFFINW